MLQCIEGIFPQKYVKKIMFLKVYLELGTKSLFRYSVTVIRYSLLSFVSNDHALESMSNDVMSNYLVLYI
jgi:hypothetical protein